jgi:DNA polymerase/3'-5' exonuclease PolX
MSGKIKFPLAQAKYVAETYRGALAPLCHRIEIAGSIRREKSQVGDIELVYIPRLEIKPTPGDMFSFCDVDLAELCLQNLLRQGFLDKRKKITGETVWGKQIKLAVDLESGIPVDFFPTSEISWWNYLVCRTGPKESNMEIAHQAILRGLKWEPYSAGFRDGDRIVPMKSEMDVFEFVGLKYREPKDRI